MPRLDRLSDAARTTLLTFPARASATAPFSRLGRPRAACRLALVTTAGLHRRGDRPFAPGDQSYRVIPSATPTAEIVQSHTSIGFDRAAIMRDVNVSFPIDRVRELVAAGELGGLAPSGYSFMGALRDVGHLLGVTGPEVARRLRDEDVDIALVTPTWPLCTHTGGVLARVLETHGIVTTSISLVREHTEAVKPPRALFVPFPYGHALGRPDDPALQHRVLRAALALTDEAAGPVLRDFPDEGGPDDQPAAPTQASAVTPAPLTTGDPVAETQAMGDAYRRWLAQRGGRTAFGLGGVPLARFAETVRTLTTFADGGDVEFPDRRPEVPLPGYVRWCADDVKALFAEGYMATKPGAGGDEIARWFWGETAAGQLLRRVRARLDASEDPRWKAAAFGVAR